MFWWIIIGVLGGIAGGMGMGGGTLLIPLVTVILKMPQKQAQLLNLISFVIMAVFALIVHIKNRLVKINIGTIFSIFGLISAVITSLFARGISGKTLRILFGLFLIVLSCIEFAKTIKKKLVKKAAFKNAQNL